MKPKGAHQKYQILRNLRGKIKPISLTLLLLFGLYLISRSIPQQAVRSFIEAAGPFAPLVFVLSTVLTHIFAPLSGTPFLFAGFYLFGQKVVFYSILASLISSVTNFWIARIWGRGLVERFVGKSNMKRVDGLAKDYGLLTLFFMRIFLGGFHDFISYAAGLTSLRFSHYFIVSTIGKIPGTLIWYTLSLQVATPTGFIILTLLMATLFSTFFFFGSLLIKRLKKGNTYRN